MRVVAAMSGGVDSAVAAARAAEAGHDVTGIHLALSRNPASYRSGARGLLHDRGRQRRPPGRRRDRHPVLRLGPLRPVPRGRGRGLHGRVRRRPDAQPVPAVQREDQVRRRARPGARARLRRGRDRPLRAAAHRRRRAGRDAPGGRPRQGPVLRARRARPAAAAPLAVPARRHRPSPPSARRRRAAGCWSPTSPTATTSASSPTATTPAGSPRSSATGPPTTGGDIVDSGSGEVLGEHAGTYGFTIGQRKGLRIGRPAPDGKPRFVLDIEPVTGTVTVGPREELAVDRITGIRPRWCGTVPTRLEGADVTVQLRAHGDEHRAVVAVDRRPGRDRAARPGVRHRPGPGGRRLRRHPRRRLGHHRVDRASGRRRRRR